MNVPFIWWFSHFERYSIMNADSTAFYMYCTALDGSFLYFVIHLIKWEIDKNKNENVSFFIFYSSIKF